MADDENESSSSFPIGKTAQERGLSYVPKCYMMPPSQRPSLNSEIANVHVVDLANANEDNPLERSIIVHDIAQACRRNGFFQVSLPLCTGTAEFEAAQRTINEVVLIINFTLLV